MKTFSNVANQCHLVPPWADEKLVLHKLGVHPDSVARFSPPCEGGVRGGGPGGTRAWYAVPGRLDPAESPPRPKVLVMPCSPPLPFARGGKGSLARAVIRSRATKTRVSKPSLQHGQHQLFISPVPPHRSDPRWAKPRSETPEPIAHDLADGDCTNPFRTRVLNRFWAWRSGMKTFSNVANQCHLVPPHRSDPRWAKPAQRRPSRSPTPSPIVPDVRCRAGKARNEGVSADARSERGSDPSSARRRGGLAGIDSSADSWGSQSTWMRCELDRVTGPSRRVGVSSVSATRQHRLLA